MNKRIMTAVCLGLCGAVQAGGWEPYEKNPVLGNEKLGTCFDVNVVTDGPAPYTMYFSWRPKKAIALVRSADGFAWSQVPEICLKADPTSGWENDLNRSCTVFKDGVWHMWYTGQANGGSKIGYATSTDGVHFTRVRKEPVLVPEADYEKLSVMNPYVRWDAKRSVWRMWYAAGETYEPNVLCYAESKDGLNWTKWGRNPMFGHGEGIVWDRDRVGACEVHPLPDGRWAMFYIGYSDIDTARIGCAISEDGITGWKRLPQNPIVAPDLGTWNGSACYKPSVVRDEKNNRWLLWYNGRNGAPEYVGCAIHEGLDLEAPSSKLPDTKALLSDYVWRFNAKDEELYTNAIPNSAAEGFLLDNAPRFACPDKDIERTYYFRWWTFRKHLRRDLGHWTVTEFLPKVGWSGKDNTIVCPAGHHLREGRWLRDPQIIEDVARFWIADKEATHRWSYSSWLFTGTRLFAEVAGRDGLPRELLDAAVAYYRRWEQGFVYGKLPMGGDGKGGFLSIDDREGTEISLGGNGYKPLMSSAMWSEANAIAEVARAAGRTELADEFAAKAAKNLESLLANCWNDEIGFFTTAKADGTKGTVRELHGYAPWYFGVPTGKPADWSQLSDPQGFAARYGLTFPERRAKGFTIDYKGHECKWNGPSWPFASSVALTALANDFRSQSNNLFASLLWQYADAQRRQRDPKEEGDYTVVPWIDENLNPDKAEWLSRKIILDTPAMRKKFPKERGKDYNHSTFCDLVISGLVGFLPNGGKGFIVDPFFPETWDYLVLENLRYREHDVDIRWQRGKGLEVEVDGKSAARRETLGRLEVALAAGKTADSVRLYELSEKSSDAAVNALRFMTFNIWGDYFGNPVVEREAGVLSVILEQKPDLLSLQEVTPRWWESKLFRGLEKDYGVIRGDEEAALVRAGADLAMRQPNWINHEPLVYRRDRLTLLESGLEFYHLTLQPEKSVTWGVFEDRASGRRFIAFATHLWWQYNGLESHAIRELNVRKILDIAAALKTKWGEIPVIGGGDLNCNEEGMPALVAFERAGYSDAGKCADAVSSVPSEHTNPKRGADGRYHGEKGVVGRKGMAMLDRVFYSGGVHALRHDVICTQDALDVSDHSPVVVDFIIAE